MVLLSGSRFSRLASLRRSQERRFTSTAQTLDTIHTSFPRPMTIYLRDFLSASLRHLQALLPTFTQYYLASSTSPPGSSEDESVGLPHLLCPIIDFISTATRGGRAKEWFETGNLEALIESIFNYVQMTEEDVGLFHPPSYLIPLNQQLARFFPGGHVGFERQCFCRSRGR